MLGFLLVILGIWVVLIILGALIKGLFWLVIVGAILFLVTAAYGWTKGQLSGGRRSIEG